MDDFDFEDARPFSPGTVAGREGEWNSEDEDDTNEKSKH
jgi:hypothetical protein